MDYDDRVLMQFSEVMYNFVITRQFQYISTGQ
jgi:hypothetical protein